MIETVTSPIMICPCGSQKRYADCCRIYHRGTPAPTARLLMPSRYSAYVLGLGDYLLNTWHVTTRPEKLDFEKNISWLDLEIKHDEVIDQCHAKVEFVARYKINREEHSLHEISNFIFEDGHWYYVDGVFTEMDAIPRHRSIS